MRIKSDQNEARNVLQVLLDNKLVPMVHEFDTDEGWVKSYVVNLPDNPTMNGEELIEDSKNQQAGFILVKREGEVKVILRDSVAKA